MDFPKDVWQSIDHLILEKLFEWKKSFAISNKETISRVVHVLVSIAASSRVNDRDDVVKSLIWSD